MPQGPERRPEGETRTPTTLRERVADFLAQRRIAVAGVTRSKEDAANAIYRRLKASGHEAIAVNPHAETFAGDRCYPDLASIPGGVDAVVVVTRPEATDALVRECARLGIARVWMHQSLSGSSVSTAAVAFCRENGIAAIAGGCPMMFCGPVDFGHHCQRWLMRLTGRLPA